MQTICIYSIIFLMKDILRKSGLKATPARLQLLEFLQSVAKPVTVADIMANPEISSSINQSTAYRSLDQMAERGIIYKTYFDNESAWYEWQETHHHHVTCSDCGYREAFSSCFVPTNILDQTKKFTKIDRHIVELFGRCQKCDN